MKHHCSPHNLAVSLLNQLEASTSLGNHADKSRCQTIRGEANIWLSPQAQDMRQPISRQLEGQQCPGGAQGEDMVLS